MENKIEYKIERERKEENDLLWCCCFHLLPSVKHYGRTKYKETYPHPKEEEKKKKFNIIQSI